MKGPCRVSVVVPNYNHERFLKQRLDSIFEQTRQPDEIILLDDGSTDGSRALLRSYSKDPRVRLDFNDTNSGSPFKQWIKGIEQATGDIVWIAESDDFASPIFLETLLERLMANPAAVLAYCQSWIVDESGLRGETMLSWTDAVSKGRWAVDFQASGVEECRRFMFQRATIPNASAVIFRREAFPKSRRILKIVRGLNLRFTGDWLLWAAMAFTGEIEYCSQPLNYWRTPTMQERGTRRWPDVFRGECVVRREIASLSKPSIESRNLVAEMLESQAATLLLHPDVRLSFGWFREVFYSIWKIKGSPPITLVHVCVRKWMAWMRIHASLALKRRYF